jgi:hypothetical protein
MFGRLLGLVVLGMATAQSCDDENNTEQWIHSDARTKLYEIRQQLCGGNSVYSNCGGISSQDGSFNNTCYYAHPADNQLQGIMYGATASTDQCWVSIFLRWAAPVIIDDAGLTGSIKNAFDAIINKCMWDHNMGKFYHNGIFTWSGDIYIMTTGSNSWDN